ncbi:MAG: hypothetical protein AABM40_14380 [Chloroflexota bacterium]
MASPKGVDGTRLLYPYLQKDLLSSDVWLFQMLTARLVVDLGIWLPPIVYQRLPVLLPYAVRDPDCRGDPKNGIPDQWGSPNSAGFFRDDNSLVKVMPRSLSIESERSVYRSARMDKGFVAAHVWRRLTGGASAARDRLTYSFVPNLVWLPSDVARLTDREGSFVQAFVQALAVKTYRGLPVVPSMKRFVDQIWEMLPQPLGIPQQALPGVEDLNFFSVTPAWLARRLQKIVGVHEAFKDLRAGALHRPKVISSRYTTGLISMKPESARVLYEELDLYRNCCEDAARG